MPPKKDSGGATPAELDVLLKEVLPLLRSGALKELLSAKKKGSSPPSPAVVPAEAGGGHWATQKSKKQAKEKAEASEALVPDGWNVPPLATEEEVKASATGVFLCSTSVATRLQKEVKSTVLCPMQVEELGSEVHVLVSDKQGRTACRRRFLVQLGPPEAPVEFLCAAPKRATVPDCVKVVFRLHEDLADSSLWLAAMKTPQKVIAEWASKEAGVQLVDVGRPALRDGELTVVSHVVKTARLKLLTSSGKRGLFANPFMEGDAEAEFKVVPLPRECSHAEALRRVTGQEAHGLVRLRSGFGLRVSPDAFQLVTQMVHGDNASSFLGSVYEVAGCPLSMGPDALKAFLGEWPAMPLRSFRKGFTRTWLVRCGEMPPVKILQHDFGIAVIGPAPARRPLPQKLPLLWKPPEPAVVRRWARASTAASVGNAPVAPVAAAAAAPPVGVAAAAPHAMEVCPPTQLDASQRTAAAGSQIVATTGVDWVALISSAVAQAMAPMNERLSSLQCELVAMKSNNDAHYASDSEEELGETQRGERSAKLRRTR